MDEGKPLIVHQVALGQDGDPAPHAQQLDDGEVLLGLRHDALISGDHEQGDVDAGRAGQHVLDETLVARHVHDACLEARDERQRGEAQVDGDAAAFFFLPAVGVHTGEGLHQCGLAVVDVAGGADYETARGAGGVTHACCSQKSMALKGPDSPMW